MCVCGVVSGLFDGFKKFVEKPKKLKTAQKPFYGLYEKCQSVSDCCGTVSRITGIIYSMWGSNIERQEALLLLGPGSGKVL